MLRTSFLLAILVVSAVYTYVAFAELAFLSAAGRLGPGFFPRFIGVLLILSCIWSLWSDWRRRAEEELDFRFWFVVCAIAGLSGLLVLMFTLVGGTLAMVLFLLIALSMLNRGRIVQNVAISILLPVAIFLLFDVWLNSAMPEGSLLSLPF